MRLVRGGVACILVLIGPGRVDMFADYSKCSWLSMLCDCEMSSNSSEYYVRTIATLSYEDIISPLTGPTGFHAAMMVFAAIQVGQTKTALVTRSAAECAVNFSFVVGL